MAKNMYNFVRYHIRDFGLDRLELRIVKWHIGRIVKSWQLSQRLSRYWLIYWNDTPGAVLKFQDCTIEMIPGKMVLIPPYTLVSAETFSPFKHNFVEFEADTPFRLVKSRPLEFSAADFAPSLPPGTDKIHLSLALYILVERLLMQVPTEYFNSPENVIFEPRIQQVIKYMNNHTMKRYSAEKLAELVGMSESRLLHLFKKETGISLRKYWMKQRMELVLRLLQNTNLSIAEIAEETGFVDRSHLSRIVKSAMNMSPAEIRKEFGSGKNI